MYSDGGRTLLLEGDAVVEGLRATAALGDEVDADAADVFLGTEVLEAIYLVALYLEFHQAPVAQMDTVALVEMINETFRKPKDGEGRWWSTSEILATFSGRYAYFDAKRATPAVLGKSMNNYRFNFRHRMVNGCSEYWLCEK